MKAYLLFALTVCFIFPPRALAEKVEHSQAIFQEDVEFSKLLQSIVQLNEFGANQSPAVCSNTPSIPIRSISVPEKKFGWNLREVTKKWSSLSCKEILSGFSPKGFESIQTRWWPICSIADAANIEANLADPKQVTTSLSIPNLLDVAQRKRDLCSPQLDQKTRNLSFSKLREHSEYRAPSQNEEILIPMDDSSRLRNISRARRFAERVGASCCSENIECLTAMRSIDFYYCDHQRDRDAPDKCTRSGTSYTPIYSDNFDQIFGKVDLLDTEVNESTDISVIPGRIQLSPFVRDDLTPIDRSVSLLHELGHACSVIRNQIEAKKGNRSAIRVEAEYQNVSNSWCVLSPQKLAVFSEKLISMGASSQTIECFIGLAKTADSPTYAPGTCPNVCPGRYLEESFANWIAIALIPEELIVPDLLPRSCAAERDSMHALGVANLECALKTPFVTQRIAKVLKCK